MKNVNESIQGRVLVSGQASGPAAFVLANTDINIAVGVMVANRLYDLNVPVIEISPSQMAQINNGINFCINEEGLILTQL